MFACCRCSSKTYEVNTVPNIGVKTENPPPVIKPPDPLPDNGVIEKIENNGDVSNDAPVGPIVDDLVVTADVPTEIPDDDGDKNPVDVDDGDNPVDGGDNPVDGGEEETRERREAVFGQTVDLNQEIATYEKSDEERANIKTALYKNEFLQNILKDDQLIGIIDAMQPRTVEADELIVKQGNNGDNMFISESGSYNIIIDDILHETFRDQRVFGELAIMYNTPRLATIKAITTGKVWMLPGKVFQQITIQNALAEENSKVSFLKNVPDIKEISERKLRIISNLLKVEFFKTDTEIVKQGNKGDKFYIIKAGCATVSKEEEGVVAVLNRGAFFGERALLGEDQRRQATVKANSPGVECLYLSNEDFIENLGGDFWKKDDRRASIHQTSEYDNIKKEDLSFKGTLGVGGFGRVELVQYRKNRELVFALKMLKKRHLIDNNQQTKAINEKIAQMSFNSDFIVKLYKTYQDTRCIYYLMECCLGGDLFGLQQKQKGRCFDDKWAQFLSACVLEGLAYIHEKDYAFRDLKPENIMIDAQGYAKITDFGFAKALMDGERTYTFVGTPEYVAPEIIRQGGYGKPADFWAMGILIFELLVGKSPFKARQQQVILNLVQRGIENVLFPTKISRNAQNIIKNLCKGTPEKRLGCKKNGIHDIRNHKWYSQFDWKKLRARQIKSPFAPRLKSNCDLKYFGEFQRDSQVGPEEDMWEGF